MNKLIKIALIVIGLISAVLWFSLPSAEDPNAISSGAMNFMFIIMYILLAIAVVASVFFGLTKLLSTPGSLKKALFGIGGLAIVVAVSYGLSSNNAPVVEEMSRRGIETTEGTVKNIGMGLNVFFILTVVAVVLMVFPGLKKMFVK
ncbi:hypothetical protein D2V93_16855 [Flagellimonas taeanensis]|jgi:hypothetical protein|uniref:Uncharacterized protein n=1 Tax=Flagellimonas taeanensis TaxID=1005926 RepID=A0A1M6TBW4_9FLAO|nr:MULTISPECIES: hypothetical protein [Allomuricauda]MDC6384059.1 hypothetical protein [Muricauda sp. SK9]MEE1962133.1 hypothetical protein [Allomuricauda taeanensis]RIV48665.1 hypothetical protein D2V93_16855 [Allomuricauda taeanensis]SFB87100.1 hypothetical protein SAMN04487891_103149 [Allomuricauda taeanensis]SHK54497.1 hypothetical protein SAMN05216293_1311 [Allomuricauda taeanensis]